MHFHCCAVRLPAFIPMYHATEQKSNCSVNVHNFDREPYRYHTKWDCKLHSPLKG